MELILDFSGDVIERQELLNGTEWVTVEGASPDGWALVTGFSWNLGMLEQRGEGDLTLARHGGDEIFATLTRADVSADVSADDGGVSARAFALSYDVDGGAGAFDGASGSASAAGMLTANSFTGRWRVSLTLP
jgi:hypothetical protein